VSGSVSTSCNAVQTELLTRSAEVAQSAQPTGAQLSDSSLTVEVNDSKKENTEVIRGHGDGSQQSLKQFAAQIASEIVAMASNMEAKLGELQQLRQTSPSGHANVDDVFNVAWVPLVRTEIELKMLHNDQMAKRRRLCDEYDDVVSKLVEQNPSTVLKIPTAARVSTSPFAPTKGSNGGNAELVSC
jgi:hypothetical protein